MQTYFFKGTELSLLGTVSSRLTAFRRGDSGLDPRQASGLGGLGWETDVQKGPGAGQKAAQRWGDQPREARAPDVPLWVVLRAASGRAGLWPHPQHPHVPTRVPAHPAKSSGNLMPTV